MTSGYRVCRDTTRSKKKVKFENRGSPLCLREPRIGRGLVRLSPLIEFTRIPNVMGGGTSIARSFGKAPNRLDTVSHFGKC